MNPTSMSDSVQSHNHHIKRFISSCLIRPFVSHNNSHRSPGCLGPHVSSLLPTPQRPSPPSLCPHLLAGENSFPATKKCSVSFPAGEVNKQYCWEAAKKRSMSITIHCFLDVLDFVTMQRYFIINAANAKALFSPNSMCVHYEVVVLYA